MVPNSDQSTNVEDTQDAEGPVPPATNDAPGAMDTAPAATDDGNAPEGDTTSPPETEIGETDPADGVEEEDPAPALAMVGTDGNDFMFGGMDDAVMFGGAGNDIMLAGGGDNALFGGAGNDILIGGTGTDRLDGGDGNDTLILGSGDTGIGGAGADIFMFHVWQSDDVTISDFDASEGDQLMILGAQNAGYTLTQNSNHTEVVFDTGLSVNYFGITVAEIEADPGLFGLA